MLTFPMTGLANGCRDYQVKVEFGGDGRNAMVNYDVTNRCGNPYRGQARLEKQ